MFNYYLNLRNSFPRMGDRTPYTDKFWGEFVMNVRVASFSSFLISMKRYKNSTLIEISF